MRSHVSSGPINSISIDDSDYGAANSNHDDCDRDADQLRSAQIGGCVWQSSCVRQAQADSADA
jgi:hypothetical protein